MTTSPSPSAPVDPLCQGCGEVTLHRFRDLTLCTDCERELQAMIVRDVFSIGPNEMFAAPRQNEHEGTPT